MLWNLIRPLLEDQLQCALNLTSAGGAVVLADLRLRDPEGRRGDAQRRGRRRGNVRVVEDVVALRAEDQFYLFAQGLGLLEDDVGVDEARAVELVAMERDALSERSIGKCLGGRPNDLARRDDGAPPRGIRRSNKLWTVGDSGVEVVDRAAEIEGQAALDLLNARDLDAFEDVAEQAA